MKTDYGKQQYALHTEGDVPIVESQSDWTPIQRDFLLYSLEHHEPDEDDIPDHP